MNNSAKYVLVAALGFVLPMSLAAKEPGQLANHLEQNSASTGIPAEEKTFGTADLSVETLSALTFSPYAAIDADRFAVGPGNSRGCTDQCTFVGNFALPTGSIIEKMEIAYVDASSNVAISFLLQECPDSAVCSDLAYMDSFGNPGSVVEDVAVNEVVDSSTRSYTVKVLFSDGDNTFDARVQNVRLYYRRQMSPAPSTATFNDVPTGHPFFRAIEALAASGISGGCGGGDFCPNNTVTRGQMAVFLARALGLHWPN